MAVIDNEDIRRTFHFLSTLDNILQKEVQMINGNKSYVDKIVPNSLVGIYSQKEKVALQFAHDISQTSYESSVVTLLATFERIIFAKYKTTYGTIKSYVGDFTTGQIDYFKSKEKFVNGSIDKLHAIIELIEGHVENELIRKLKSIKDQRDYIAHGKRFGQPQAIAMTLEEIAKTLDDVISEIEKDDDFLMADNLRHYSASTSIK